MARKVRGSAKSKPSGSSRRDFLKSATTVAAGLVAPPAKAAEIDLLPTVALGPHRITRLIVGSNPIYGYSHVNKLYDQHMLEWFTDERIVQLLMDCEKAGINTWQASFHWNMKRQFPSCAGQDARSSSSALSPRGITMRKCRARWTLFWREPSNALRPPPSSNRSGWPSMAEPPISSTGQGSWTC